MRTLFSTSLAIAGLVGALALPALAQNTADSRDMEFAGLSVRPLANPDRVKVVEQDGRSVLVVERAAVMLDGIAFAALMERELGGSI